MSGYVVGIDLGTSNTVAVIRSPDGRRRPVLFDGAPLMPSAVYLQDNGQLAVGRDAQRLAQLDPSRYEPNPKRRIDEAAVLLGSAEVPTVHLLASVLRAAAVGVSEITRVPPPVVLTYPASWAQTRRRLLHDAAIAAGWRQVSLVPEPVAAARYFISALNHPLPRGSAMVVYDFGGGTIDIAVVRNDPQGFVVVGSGGLEDVGGLDLDAALVEQLGEVLRASEPDVWRRLQDPRTAQERRDRRLFWEDIRGAKEMLSRTAVAPVTVPGVEAALHLTRDELEAKIGPMIALTVAETARVVRECGLSTAQLAGIMLVGGSSRVPLVARMLHRELGVVPTVLEQPELPVAEGAIVHPSELTTDGRLAVATGKAAVVSAPPAAYSTEAVPVSGIPVSAAPVSSPVYSAAPVSPAPAPVPEPAPAPGGGRRRAALIAGIVVLLMLLGGAAYLLKGPSPIGSWTSLLDLPTELDGIKVGIEGAGAVVTGNKLYVIGGFTANEPRTQLNSVWVYDLRGGASAGWVKGPPLPEALSHMAVVLDGKATIWVIGGLTTEGGTKDVWTLAAGAGQWQAGPPLPEPRNSGAGVFDGTGVVFAGGTRPDHDPSDLVWALDNGKWSEIGRLSVPREKLTATTDGTGTIWFLGGVQQTAGNATKDTVDVMSRRKMDTNAHLKLDHPREGASAVKIEGIGLCVLGGHDGPQNFYNWWCDDPKQTPKLPNLELPRAGMALAVSGGTIYVVGGYNQSKNVNGTRLVQAFKYTTS